MAGGIDSDDDDLDDLTQAQPPSVHEPVTASPPHRRGASAAARQESFRVSCNHDHVELS